MSKAAELKKLQSLCQSWILTGFPGSKILASGGHFFAAESAQGDLCLYEIRWEGTVSTMPQGLLEQKRLKDAMVRATLRKKNVLEALIVALPVAACQPPQFRFDPRTRSLQWAHLYPDEELPTLEITAKKAVVPKDTKGTLVVTHKMKGFGLTQVHVYGLLLKDISQKLSSSILEHANYPSLIPHSHTILDGEAVIYDRKIEHWAEHAATKDAYTGSVRGFVCVGCRSRFFGFVGEERCRECQEVVGVGVVKVKNGLIKKAQSLADSKDWKAAGDSMRELMDQWKAAGHAGDKEDGLWEKFQAARQPFFDARTAFFDARDAGKGISVDRKKSLIERAKKNNQSTDWRATSGLMKDLLNEWKAAGHAGDQEETLWREFSEARQVFYARQNEYFGN